MNNYALTLVIKPNLDEKARKELIEDVKKKFGKLNKEEEWGMRDLAYPIKHQTKGFYVHFEFEAEPAKAPELDKFLKLEENLLRYLLVRV